MTANKLFWNHIHFSLKFVCKSVQFWLFTGAANKNTILNVYLFLILSGKGNADSDLGSPKVGSGKGQPRKHHCPSLSSSQYPFLVIVITVKCEGPRTYKIWSAHWVSCSGEVSPMVSCHPRRGDAALPPPPAPCQPCAPASSRAFLCPWGANPRC